MEVTTATASQSRDEFLQLLVTQLRHQDPLSPVKQEDFLAQLAQFSTLESVEQLNVNLASQLEIQTNILKLQQFSQAAELIGRYIEFETIDGATSSGRVNAVSVRDNGIRVTVGDQTVSIEQITALVTPAPVVDDGVSPTLRDESIVDESVTLNSDRFGEDATSLDHGPPLVQRLDT